MGKKYLITGGYGLIGSSLVNKLDGEIKIVSRSPDKNNRVKVDHNCIIKPIDEISSEDLHDIDVIYHFASTVDNYNILSDPYIDTKTNIIGTTKILEIIKNFKKKPKIIFLSTFFVYGNVYDQNKIPINEDSPTNPLALYPATKLCTENFIKIYSKLHNIPYLICRLTNVYSENEDFTNKKKGGLNYMIMQAVKGENISLYMGGDFYRDYIHVNDVVDCLMFIEEKVINQTFLVGFGRPILFKDMIDELLRLTNYKSKILNVDPPEFHKVVGITNFIADTKKINSLGWDAKIDYKEGLKRIVEKYKTLL